MQPDNDYPNAGEFFGVPQETKTDDDPNSKLQKAPELIQTVIERFNKRIAYLKDLDSITEDVTVNPEIHKRLVEINRGIKLGIENERDFLMGLINKSR